VSPTIEELEKRNRWLSRLVELSVTLNSMLDLEALLQLVTATACELLKCEAASILLHDEKQNRLYFAAATGSDPKELAGIPVPIIGSLAGSIFRENRPILLNSVEGDTRHYLTVSEQTNFKVRSLLGVPMLIKDRAIGVIEALNKIDEPFDEQDEAILFVTATHAAIAIHNARLFREAELSQEELRQAYDDTIKGWSRALDLRDHETKGHTERVAELTVKLAQAYGMSEHEVIQIRRGALLHDMGKLGVPDSILLKPGDLTEAERGIILNHPEYAFQMLSPIDYLKPALDIPRYHHERWDGTGYTHGLKGEDIPIAARLFTVVDVWDALNSDRPYHKGWSPEKAAEYIRSQGGKQFDPQVVDLFLRMIATGEKLLLGRESDRFAGY
jgi:HD-GYP domain-containing protein (c-di-GMP phosphodiesterase class II)